jgi:hypothetical protein
MLNKFTKYFLISLLFLSLASCANVTDITKSLINLKNLEYRLTGVEAVRLSGVEFRKGMALTDIGLMDVAKLTSSLSKGKMPIDFILNLEARNPNEDKGKRFSTTATIESFDFDVFLDNNKAFTGGLANPVKIESNGGIKVIPLKISLDLTDLYKDKQYDKLANIALNLAGFDLEKTKIRVEATPVVGTPIGKMKPGRITISDTKY